MLLLAVVLAFSTELSVRALRLPRWCYYAVLLFLAFTFYAGNSMLIRRYIARRAPSFASTEEVAPGVQRWELTAGTGVVPRWVSFLGLASVACLFALAFPFVASLFRR